jgi:hypothetical protein
VKKAGTAGYGKSFPMRRQFLFFHCTGSCFFQLEFIRSDLVFVPADGMLTSLYAGSSSFFTIQILAFSNLNSFGLTLCSFLRTVCLLLCTPAVPLFSLYRFLLFPIGVHSV